MKGFIVFFGLMIGFSSLFAQSDDDRTDTTDILPEVMVRAYENYSKIMDAPTAVSVISKSQFTRFGNIGILPAVNTTPGVRMEERSPGSYRLNIRGSSLRSPFGVRNVKVYYNNIPYTDPGGNTYLNQLGFYNIESMEIIKGPGSSLYGAGTGGVILINSESEKFKRNAFADIISGSFNTQSVHGGIQAGSENLHHTINYQYQKSDGYRDHTKMERRVVSWDGTAKVGEKGVLQAHFLQGSLFYETPGALNAAEYASNPKAARPGVGQTPGAEAAQAAIEQKMYVAGFSYFLKWDEHWQSTTSIYGAYSRVTNPTTRNYERRTEPHFGTRNTLQFTTMLDKSKLTVVGGIEGQQGFSAVRVYKNNGGIPDALQTDDELENKQMFIFGQATLELPNNWILTAGASLNQLKVKTLRLSLPTSAYNKTYNNELAPRLAVLKRITPTISVYGSVAKGFSPPTNAELLPSTSVISTNLEAEKGNNLEAGTRGSLLKGKLYFDINTFYFRLKNTIAQRRDFSGGDYFVNSGSTDQNGLETYLSYRLIDSRHKFFNSLKLWMSHTWSNFKYKQFEKVTADTVDYSGNRLPSIPKHYVAAGLDITTKTGAYANLTYYYSDRLALNDANTDYASSYNLLGAKIGFRKILANRFQLDIFAVADNLFDVKYSLGNDINAFGGRYYNAAPGRNFAVGASMRLWY